MPFRARRDDPKLHCRRAIPVLAFAAALVVAIGVHDAAAKKKRGRESVVAVVNGKRRSWNAKKIGVTVEPLTGSLSSVSVIAAVKHPHLNQLVPGLSLSCEVDLTGTFPVTPVFPQQLCLVGYTEIRTSRNPTYKSWGGSNADQAVQFTLDSLVGNRLTGTFHGTLTSQGTPNPPVTIENGTFSIDVSH
jgi:hypothetical protein